MARDVNFNRDVDCVEFAEFCVQGGDGFIRCSISRGLSQEERLKRSVEDIALDKASTYGTEDWVSDFRIRYLPGISHWVQQEAPEAVNAMIAAFIKREPVPEMKWQMVFQF